MMAMDRDDLIATIHDQMVVVYMHEAMAAKPRMSVNDLEAQIVEQLCSNRDGSQSRRPSHARSVNE